MYASLPKVTDLLSDFCTASATSWPAAPTRPAMASSGAFGSSGLPAAPSGRLAAAAAHRAALRDIDADNISDDNGDNKSRCGQECRHFPESCILHIHISAITIYGNETKRLYSAIGDIDTVDDSRLRRDFASYLCEAQCKASVVRSHCGLGHLCGAKVIKAVSCGQFRKRCLRNSPCWVYKAPLCRRSRHRRAKGR